MLQARRTPHAAAFEGARQWVASLLPRAADVKDANIICV
jgi:hypothetical protein